MRRRRHLARELCKKKKASIPLSSLFQHLHPFSSPPFFDAARSTVFPSGAPFAIPFFFRCDESASWNIRSIPVFVVADVCIAVEGGGFEPMKPGECKKVTLRLTLCSCLPSPMQMLPTPSVPKLPLQSSRNKTNKLKRQDFKLGSSRFPQTASTPSESPSPEPINQIPSLGKPGPDRRRSRA